MLVTTAVENGVATLTLNDPAKKNAMSEALADAFAAAVAALKQDAAVRVCLLRGEGGTFSSGGDLAMLEKLRAFSPTDARAFMLGYYARFLSILDLPVPTIAVVEGAAIGAGLGLALACDLTIVADDAACSLSFVKLGLHPGLGTTFFAPLRFGRAHAAELLLTGRSFDGAHLHRIGGAFASVPQRELLVRALQTAEAIAQNGALAVRALKQNLQVDRSALAVALDKEALAQAESYASADLGEGLLAIKAKRKATF
jgi:enoyl-CoA hydratase/carnithine racemase